MHQSMASRFNCKGEMVPLKPSIFDQKHADNSESRDIDSKTIGPRSADSVAAANELFHPA